MFSSKRKYFGINQPIFSILGYKDKVYFAGGGGGKKYGVKNTILTYKRTAPAGQLSEIVNEMDTGSDLLQRMHLNLKEEIVTACSDGNMVFFHLNASSGVMTFLKRISADFTEPEAPSLNDAKLNENASIALSGGDDGILRLWDVRVNTSSLSERSIDVEKKYELASHSGPINGVDFHPTKPLVISASDDKSCRIFNINTQQLLQKLTLGVDGLHDSNFKFFAAFFSSDEKSIYTIENPSRGTSYITRWEMDTDSVMPVTTLQAHHQPISACCMSKEGMFLGLGGCDGTLKIVNLHHLQIEAEQTHLDMVVKGVDFTGDSRFLVGGTPESNFDILQNMRPQGKATQLMKLSFFIMFLLWIYLFFTQQGGPLNEIQG